MNFLSWMTCCCSEKVENEDQSKRDEEPMILEESPMTVIKKVLGKPEKEVRGEGTIRFCRPPEETYGKHRITKRVTLSPYTRFQPKRKAASDVEPEIQQHVLKYFDELDDVNEENKSFHNKMNSLK